MAFILQPEARIGVLMTASVDEIVTFLKGDPDDLGNLRLPGTRLLAVLETMGAGERIGSSQGTGFQPSDLGRALAAAKLGVFRMPELGEGEVLMRIETDIGLFRNGRPPLQSSLSLVHQLIRTHLPGRDQVPAFAVGTIWRELFLQFSEGQNKDHPAVTLWKEVREIWVGAAARGKPYKGSRLELEQIVMLSDRLSLRLG